MGPFTIELYYEHAPRTCRNFIELSRRGYYDNVKFHRIIKDIVVQGGDPTGTSRGGESIYGSKFEDEIKPELKHTGAGILSMANNLYPPSMLKTILSMVCRVVSTWVHIFKNNSLCMLKDYNRRSVHALSLDIPSTCVEGGPPEVTLETSMGPFTIELYYKHAPRTCRNFIELSRRGYYDNVKFHRIIEDFVVQGGDPTGTSRGGESIYG
ncbi:hypothetical protein IFM89_025361 [Coptis chinensis]|uniref:Peptidyl-prolyl cis-trans isomerase n=1 Tax=Coptis chinensis TaxID=261450 RepID=A0A835HFA9_9MAGN|nr:hypothetical protein IFM89_025361 [Coptis chinensis]